LRPGHVVAPEHVKEALDEVVSKTGGSATLATKEMKNAVLNESAQG
jgi:hypothetical protein